MPGPYFSFPPSKSSLSLCAWPVSFLNMATTSTAPVLAGAMVLLTRRSHGCLRHLRACASDQTLFGVSPLARLRRADLRVTKRSLSSDLCQALEPCVSYFSDSLERAFPQDCNFATARAFSWTAEASASHLCEGHRAHK